jgi:hypothetical protein
MSKSEVDLFRSVRHEVFPDGTIIDNKPAPGVLYPDFEARRLPDGNIREADVVYPNAKDRSIIATGGGTSLFDRPNVFSAKNGWLSFPIPEGTVVPDSLVIRNTGYNRSRKATHYQIECRAAMMRVDAYKGALDNLARNAVVRSIDLATGKK